MFAPSQNLHCHPGGWDEGRIQPILWLSPQQYRLLSSCFYVLLNNAIIFEYSSFMLKVSKSVTYIEVSRSTEIEANSRTQNTWFRSWYLLAFNRHIVLNLVLLPFCTSFSFSGLGRPTNEYMNFLITLIARKKVKHTVTT